MFLSRMSLNPARRDTRRLVSSRQRLHAAVMASLPPGPPDEPRMLWRLDQQDHQLTLYVVSSRRPDLTHLVEQAGWPTTEAWDTRDYQPFLDRLSTGQTWHFRLTGNAVKQVSREGARSRFMGARTAEQAEEWLLKRQEIGGFTICHNDLESSRDPGVSALDAAVVGLGPWRFEKGGASGGRTVTITAATFEGTLRVDDAERLRAALTGGIGRARGYGCGLITLAPPDHG